MRTIILLIFAVMCFGTCVGQEFDETIVVHNTQYQVVDRQFNHVFDAEDGTPVSFRIGWLTNDGIIIETTWRDPLRHWPRPQWNNPDEFPYLRFYVNGGTQHQEYAQHDQTHTFFIRIPKTSNPSMDHLNFQWEWRGEVTLEGGVSQSPRVFRPRLIGKRWAPRRNN